jgi:TonB family protein
MEALATYLIKSSVWLTGFALVYALFLRNERFFVLNRIYLISGILISIIFPFFTWHYTVLLPVVPTTEVFEPQIQGIAEVSEPFPLQNVLLLSLYISGIIYLIFSILRQTLPVFRIIRKSETQHFSSAKLIRTAEYPASFSFFSFVFVNPSIDEIETNEIVNHELEHIRQQHWIDLLLFEILRTVQWFNPAIWLYGHLIRQNHEYLADERALQRSSNPAIYRAALLNQMFGGPVISLANSFNYSLNKKRFNMMKQTISSPIRKLKLLFVLPLIAGVFYAFAAPKYRFENATENQGTEKSLYFISKEKIDISFTTQLQKIDLETIKAELLAKVGLQIDYTSLDFTENGNLRQISASIKYSDGTGSSFASGELTPTNYPTFRTASDGSFGIYLQKAVTGKVISEDGKPLKGASVIVSGKTIGTITDAIGNFKLILTDNSPIVVSYVGFESVKLNPDFEKEMFVTMKTTTIGIEAMGNEISASKPSEISDNVLVIIDGKESTKAEMEKINPDKIASIDVLKDKASAEKYGGKGKDGVILITLKTDNQSTQSQTFKVQTNSPLKFENTGAGNQPLIVIDGIVEKNLNVNNIPPENIESISVLKNESATKIYGEKGKDGVILITTKKEAAATTGGKTSELIVIGYRNDPKINLSNTFNSKIEFRDTKTFGAANNPLIVIDGIVSPDTKMDDIDPETIHSVNVLKGESATAKYGDKGKNGVVEINTKKTSDVFTMVEEMPQFPGGFEALKNYVAASMKYPTIALENGIHGQVFVKFMVDKSGNVTNAKVSRSVDPSLDKEALRIVNSLPNWTPGKQNGEAVDVAYELPINFNLPADYHPKSREKLRVTADSYTKANKTLKLSIVPNPTSDDARITLDGSRSTNKLEISVYDSSGKLIKNASKNGSIFSLSINKLSPGIYLVVGIDSENQLKVTSQLVVNQ